MATCVCPLCGAVNQTGLSDRRCWGCEATLPDEAASAAETPQHSEQVAEFDLVPKYSGSPSALESTFPEQKIRRSDHGETLAVLALLLPLVAQGLALASPLDSLGFQTALGLGTVFVTALVLAVDAAFLGTRDLQGRQRSNPGALFFGMFCLWIVFYPVAFFRRRHFVVRTLAR